MLKNTDNIFFVFFGASWYSSRERSKKNQKTLKIKEIIDRDLDEKNPPGGYGDQRDGILKKRQKKHFHIFKQKLLVKLPVQEAKT